MSTKNRVNQIWKSKSEIIDGIKNRIFTSETVENLSKERMTECDKCENIDREGTHCVVPGTAPCCKLCGCCLSLATRSLYYKCEMGKWENYISKSESEDLAIILRYVELLESAYRDKKINKENFELWLNDLTSEDEKVALNVRMKIRFEL